MTIFPRCTYEQYKKMSMEFSVMFTPPPDRPAFYENVCLKIISESLEKVCPRKIMQVYKVL